MNKLSTTTWFERVPKVELHLHLEGAIPLDALWQLVQKYGTDSSVADIDALKRKFQYKDFPHFIETWVWKNQFLREYDDFTFIAEAVAKNLARQNIKYAEMFYSPLPFALNRLKPQKLTEAVRTGLTRVKQTEISLIMDFSRDNGVADAEKNLPAVNEMKQMGVIGVGLGGYVDASASAALMHRAIPSRLDSLMCDPPLHVWKPRISALRRRQHPG